MEAELLPFFLKKRPLNDSFSNFRRIDPDTFLPVLLYKSQEGLSIDGKCCFDLTTGLVGKHLLIDAPAELVQEHEY